MIAGDCAIRGRSGASKKGRSGLRYGKQACFRGNIGHLLRSADQIGKLSWIIGTVVLSPIYLVSYDS